MTDNSVRSLDARIKFIHGKTAFLSIQLGKKICYTFFWELEEIIHRKNCKYSTEFSLDILGKTEIHLSLSVNIQF